MNSARLNVGRCDFYVLNAHDEQNFTKIFAFGVEGESLEYDYSYFYHPKKGICHYHFKELE